MKRGKTLIYLVRRDLRVADNPILHHLTTNTDHGYTHVLPIYVFDPIQIEISGFLKRGETSPYPPARSAVGGFWRTGPHRVKFIAQSVWDLKQSLEQLNSGLMLRFGPPPEIIKQIIEALKCGPQSVGGVYMTEEMSSEEVDEQRRIKQICHERAVDFQLWPDEKYFIDDRDTGLANPQDLPDIFTSYRKLQEPLRDRPRTPLPRPEKFKMLPLPDYARDTSVDGPFIIPRTQEDCVARLLDPLKDLRVTPPPRPDGVGSAHPFSGGETRGWERIEYLIRAGGMTRYKDTRNGLLGPDFSTKLSAYLALGCVTARQVHHELAKFEDGKDEKYKSGPGFGQGENDGSHGVRFELLWRDYMRLCTIKFGKRLFHLHGFRQKDKYDREWKTADASRAVEGQFPAPKDVARLLERIFTGTTGLGLIDASQRELFYTGYTSNRARQNVASFLAKHLDIDWRYGAEWYEMLLVDYDVSSNWANWQYVAGVGNDPRGDERNFNPVKQAFDYDKDGSYVRSWIPELRHIDRLECLFQVSTSRSWELVSCGLENNLMATHPVKRIQFVPNRKPRPTGKQWRGGGAGGGAGGGRAGAGGWHGNRPGGGAGRVHGNRIGPPGAVNHGWPENDPAGDRHADQPDQPEDPEENAEASHDDHPGDSPQEDTEHHGGHGGPGTGGESTSDALWSDDMGSQEADGPSSDDANAQSKQLQQDSEPSVSRTWVPQQSLPQPSLPQPSLPQPSPPQPSVSQLSFPLPPRPNVRIPSQRNLRMGRGGNQVGPRVDQGPHHRGWNHGGSRQYTLPPRPPPPAWRRPYPPAPPPHSNVYFNGTSPGNHNYEPSHHGPGSMPASEFVPPPPAPQPWLPPPLNPMAHPVYGEPVYVEPVRPGGGIMSRHVPPMLPPGPPGPHMVSSYQPMGHHQPPQPIPPPLPLSALVVNHHVPQPVPPQEAPRKQMRVEAEPFVPRHLREAGNPVGGGTTAQPEATAISSPTGAPSVPGNTSPVSPPAAREVPSVLVVCGTAMAR